MLPFSIHMGTALYIAKDYEFYSDDLEASESFGEYEIVSATMEVKHEDDIYDITFAGVLDNGEEVRGYYKGKITYSNGGNDAPAMIK